MKRIIYQTGYFSKGIHCRQKKKYFNPFTFFLILAAFYVLSASLRAHDDNSSKSIPDSILKIENPVKKQESILIYQRVIKTQQFFSRNANVVAMIAVPFFAFYFWLVFYRKAYSYSEHLVANLLFISFSNIAFTLLVFPIQMLLKIHQ